MLYENIVESRGIMKIKGQFVSRTIADENLLIPAGEIAMKIKGLIAVSESGKLLFDHLVTGCSQDELVALLMSEYDVDLETARTDVESFLNQMRQLNMLEEE